MRWLLILALCCPAWAATYNAASCAAADVNTAIGLASSGGGDTVVVPAGSCSWAGLTISKAVTVQASGSVSISGMVTINQAAALIRVTGFTFTSAGTNGACGAMTINGTPTSFLTEIDHNTFTNNTQSTFLCTNGNGPVLITTNSFTDGGASEMIHNLGTGDASGWTNDFTPGSPNQVYIENNTFTDTDSTFIASAVESYYSARTVIRYNNFYFSQIDQHGTAGNVGVRWWEAYNNVFHPGGLNQCCYIVMRAGSGVIFGNSVVGSNTGAGTITLEEEDSGYPALYQIGRGINEDYSPAYVWGTFENSGITGSGSSNVVKGRDFFLSATQPGTMTRCELAADGGTANGLQGSCPTTYVYTPYTYPYPIPGGGNPQAGTPTFSPGAGSYSSAQAVTISNPSSAPVVCYNTTGSPATNGATGCTTGSVYSTPVTVSTSKTLYAVAGGTGYTDSSVGSAAYVITIPVPMPPTNLLAAVH